MRRRGGMVTRMRVRGQPMDSTPVLMHAARLLTHAAH